MAKSVYREHQGVVEDVAWHCHHADIFGSVGDDKHLILWDLRRPPGSSEWRGRGVLGCRPSVVSIWWAHS
jgi:hypothetical protein